MARTRSAHPSDGAGDSGRGGPPDLEAVFRAMNQASKKWPHYFDKAMGIPDLRLTEFAVLQQLSESGPTPMVRLSDENLVTKAAVTAIIDAMEAKGLVQRSRDASDRRVVNIQMTTAGKKLYGFARRRHRAVVAAFLSVLDPGEARTLLQSFEKLNRFIEQHPGAISPAEAVPDHAPQE